MYILTLLCNQKENYYCWSSMIMSSYFNVFAPKNDKDLCWYHPKPHYARGVSKLLEGSVNSHIKWLAFIFLRVSRVTSPSRKSLFMQLKCDSSPSCRLEFPSLKESMSLSNAFGGFRALNTCWGPCTGGWSYTTRWWQSNEAQLTDFCRIWFCFRNLLSVWTFSDPTH